MPGNAPAQDARGHTGGRIVPPRLGGRCQGWPSAFCGAPRSEGWGLVKIMRYWFPSVVPVVRHALAWRLGQAPFDPAPQHFEVGTFAFDRFRLISFNELACFV